MIVATRTTMMLPSLARMGPSSARLLRTSALQATTASKASNIPPTGLFLQSPFAASHPDRSISRHFSSTSYFREALKTTPSQRSSAPESNASAAQGKEVVLASYAGPMAKTFYRLKVFSLTSLFMATCFVPLFLFAPAAGGNDLSLAARCALCVTGLATSGASTALVSWIGKPYVGRMALVQFEGQDAKPVLETFTLDWKLRTVKTYIYQPQLIRPTSRPFATWELPEKTGPVPVELGEGDGDKILVSRSFDAKTGAEVGSWWASPVPETEANTSEQGATRQLECYAEGKPVRHFQVHEQALGDDFRIL